MTETPDPAPDVQRALTQRCTSCHVNAPPSSSHRYCRGSETLTMAKDSTGMLWTTYTLGRKVSARIARPDPVAPPDAVPHQGD